MTIRPFTKHLFGVFLLLIILSLISACELKPCENFACVNGTPQPNARDCFCICDKGWRGADCTQETPCVTQNVVCLNGGFCEGGDCVCPVGFEGDSCEIFSRDRFIATYHAIDSCDDQGFLIYIITIYADEDAQSIQLSNELASSQFPDSVEAVVNGNTFIIPEQLVSSTSISITGSGVLSSTGDSVAVSYRIIDSSVFPSEVEECRGIWVKQ